MIKLFGIKNCDSVKKARAWLDKHDIAYQFHDFRVDGLSSEQLDYLMEQAGWQILLNKRSNSWRQLDDQQKVDLTKEKAADLMISNPTLIKRPVLQRGEQILAGFNAKNYQTLVSDLHE